MATTIRTLAEIRSHIRDVTRVTQKNDMIDGMIKFEKALKKHIKDLKI